ncbi:MAG: peptide deformylase [Deltaproteobacteria bacterium]|nr:peptide deformylase [Deltaproteobacteria bacterium]
MSILPIRTYPDPVLRENVALEREIDQTLIDLARDMAETMYSAPGVGLAAPQVGESRRLIVIDVSPKDGPRNLITAVNPEIILQDGESHEEEGCLSVPEYYSRVERSARIKVKYLDLEGKEITLDAGGLLAICFQHEIDHLDGILFVDHLSPLKKSMFRKKYKKIMAHAQEKM